MSWIILVRVCSCSPNRAVLSVPLHSWGVPGRAPGSAAEAGTRVHQHQSGWRRPEGKSVCFLCSCEGEEFKVKWVSPICIRAAVNAGSQDLRGNELVFPKWKQCKFSQIPVAEDLFKRHCPPPPSRCAMSKGIESSAWPMRCLDTTDGLTPSLSRMSVRLAGLLDAQHSHQATATRSHEQSSFVLQTLLTSSTGSFMLESVHLSEYSWRSDHDSFPFFFPKYCCLCCAHPLWLASGTWLRITCSTPPGRSVSWGCRLWSQWRTEVEGSLPGKGEKGSGHWWHEESTQVLTYSVSHQPETIT